MFVVALNDWENNNLQDHISLLEKAYEIIQTQRENIFGVTDVSIVPQNVRHTKVANLCQWPCTAQKQELKFVSSVFSVLILPSSAHWLI